MVAAAVIGTIVIYITVAGAVAQSSPTNGGDEEMDILMGLVWPVTLPFAVGRRLVGGGRRQLPEARINE